jgi:hypothetical protein
MKVFLPFTEIQPGTLTSLTPYEYVPIAMEDNFSYPRYFKGRWREGESFINCEHDTIFHKGAIEELIRCPEIWCAFGVSYADKYAQGTAPNLSLVKFTSEFIKKFPDLWEQMEDVEYVAKAWGVKPSNFETFKQNVWSSPWTLCDAWVFMAATTEGIVCHQHYPDVVNANPRYPS